jgi:hypothetical protein
MTEPQGKTSKNHAATVLSIMTMFVPVLYLVGYFYEYGYLSGFGISSEFFPRSIQENLVNAFLAFIQFVIAIFTLAKNNIDKLLILGGIITLLTFIIMLIEKKKDYLIYKLTKIRKYKHIDMILLPITAGIFGVFIPYVILIILGFIVLIPYSSYMQGAYDAEKSILKYRQELKENKDKSIYIFKDGNLAIKGMFIAKSNQHIAIFDGVTSTIYPLKEENINTHPTPETKKSNEKNMAH